MWNEIQPGQVLLTKGRVLRVGQRVAFTEWKQHVVESVTKVFYVVNGEKYRKEHCGKQFMRNFYFPGVDGAPDNATDPDEYKFMREKVKVIDSVGVIVHPGLHKITDINKAAELAIKLQSLLDEISQQPKCEE